ncbi:MAG TPA: nucleotide sugar dehydrogenase [Candidatus Saccharimonadales bacterium]|nr:nucleotide sugar dehydrogenase [Candidatus Saccharimonadales bacterium]
MVGDKPNQDIVMVGAGYVGLVTAVGLADLGHKVSCVEINKSRVEQLKDGKVPFQEPQVPELLTKGMNNKKLEIFESLADAYNGQRYVFIAVQTPTGKDGKSDLTALFAAITSIADTVTKPTLVIVKSTVPVGSFDLLEELPAVKNSKNITFVSCPEFLSEGTAVHGFFHPQRTIVGSDDQSVSEEVAGLFYGLGGKFIVTDAKTAQMIKYTSNAFLATRVAFTNDISELCEKLDINANDVSKALIMDPRMGTSHLMPGMCFDGPCLPKDIAALIETGEKVGIPALLLKGVNEHNASHLNHIIETAKKLVGDGDTVAFYGLAFMPKTNDVRNAMGLKIIEALAESGIKVRATDPEAISVAKELISHKNLTFVEDPFEAAQGSDVQLFITRWDEYKNIDLQKLGASVRTKQIYDLMQIIPEEEARANGFKYRAVGRAYGDAGSPVFELSENPATV